MTEATSGTSTAGDVGQQVSLQQVLEAIAALQGSVQSLTSQSGSTSAAQAQMQNQLNSLSENVSKLSDMVHEETASDVDRATVDTGRAASYVNPADDWLRGMAERDRIATVSMRNLTAMVENADALMKGYLKVADGVWARSLDHFGALPPIAPRSASGPGTSGS